MDMKLPAMARLRVALGCALIATAVSVAAQTGALPSGYWSEEKSTRLLSSAHVITLAPDLSSLHSAERAALDHLLRAGEIMHSLYEDGRHHQAHAARQRLDRLHRQRGERKDTANLITLYDLFQGPIATTLENTREPFLPVEPAAPGANVYPSDITRAELDAFLTAHPERRDALLAERTTVRRATPENLTRDLAALRRAPFSTLHARVAADLENLAKAPDRWTFYALPYSVSHGPELLAAFGHLNRAADSIEGRDAEFARYLRNRARDLLSNDYESGDASWVTGRFKRLNAQIGAYETYDDPLFGAKAFYGFSVLLRNDAATATLGRNLTGLQAIEDALPYERHKRVKDDIAVGIYDVVADFGQARSTNTATILPNDPLFSRRYGRTILLRENILRHPELFAADIRVWQEVVASPHETDLTSNGSFQRTLWHEIGHYLGVDLDPQGRPLDVALAEYADALEEMKADLVSLFAHHQMAEAGSVTQAMLREVEASGIRRVILNNQPRPDQPYQRMQLAQFNFFLERGLLTFDPSSKLVIHYGLYRETVTALLREVLAVQASGDKRKAAAFFERWGAWFPDRHANLAARVRARQGARFRILRYAAVDSAGASR
jgi:hypothetical protein